MCLSNIFKYKISVKTQPFTYYTITTSGLNVLTLWSHHQALGIAEWTIYLDNLGPVLCRSWWLLERVETCSPEVVIILYNKWLCFDWYFIFVSIFLTAPFRYVFKNAEIWFFCGLFHKYYYKSPSINTTISWNSNISQYIWLHVSAYLIKPSSGL